jgi:hypothetical protein
MVEAVRMAKELADTLEEIRSQGLDVIGLIAGQTGESTHDRMRAIYEQALTKHERLTTEVVRLSVNADKVLHRYELSDYISKIQEIEARRARLDVTKLADEELLAQCERAWQSIEGIDDAFAIDIASIHIPLYSLAYSHGDVLRAFLGRPSKGRSAIEAAGALLGAGVTDVAGIAMPCLGTLKTALELMTPRIERETERMRSATEQLDRLFLLDDHLTELLAYASFVDATTKLADTCLSSARASFETDAAWLVDVYAAAARD